MTTNINSTVHWSVLELLGFRFSFIYFSLFIVIQNNGAYPFWHWIMQKPTEWLQQCIPRVGKHILGLPKDITVFTNGSGDTTYDYVIVLCIFCLSILGTFIWSFIDRKRTHYTKLFYWLTVAIRCYVALMLFKYGLIKVIKVQFGAPGFYRLIESYGDSSPMGLAWTFLGFSKGYNLFMGIAEVTAVLLLFRRTLTFGLIITLMTTANVMAVNYFYDVPVKIVSTHLVLMTLFLLLRDFKVLWQFFFTKVPVSLSIQNFPITNKNWRIASRVFKWLVISYVMGYGFIEVKRSQNMYGDNAPKPPLYGLYEMTYLEKNGEAIPADIYDTERWRYLIIENEGMAQIHKMNNSQLYFKTEIDTSKQELKLISYQDSTDTFTLKYKTNVHTFSFETTYKNDSIKATCDVIRKEDFLLMNRGFNWINEYPYNR